MSGENLGQWLESAVGRYVQLWERTQIDSAVEDVFGFNAVQIGLPEFDCLQANRIPLRFCASAGDKGTLYCDPNALPFASQSIDLIVLPHVLEFSETPHQILREAERVLRPEGHIVIAGFNPLSLWGLKRMLRGKRAGYPWCGSFIGLLRLRDWLKLLGFELNGGRFGCYAPPFATARWLARCSFMEHAGDRWWPICGAVYVVRAVKRVQGMRLVMPAWKNNGVRVKALSPVTRRERGMGKTGTHDR